MTAPVPEETNAAIDLTEAPPGEHDSELTGVDDGDGSEGAEDQGAEDQGAEDQQQENAETSLDQPST